MEFLIESLKEAVSKFSEDQKEEIYVIDSIISINKANEESMKEKLSRFFEKRKPENYVHFISICINNTQKIRPKARE